MTDERRESFKELYLRQYGRSLIDGEADERMHRLLSLFRLFAEHGDKELREAMKAGSIEEKP